MVGYVVGPLIFGPLSECIGRRPVLIGTFLGYLAFMLASSVAPSYPALLSFRLLCGISAAAPTTVISGLYADILDNASQRGTAIAVYMCVTSLGPYLAPVISGYSSEASWRWPFWVAALMAAPGLPIVLTLPETFAPVLQSGKAPSQIKPLNTRKIFLRPATLLFTEPVVLFTSLYLTLAYAIMYLMFQAFPILFEGPIPIL